MLYTNIILNVIYKINSLNVAIISQYTNNSSQGYNRYSNTTSISYIARIESYSFNVTIITPYTNNT